jgi:hypothetical protein
MVSVKVKHLVSASTPQDEFPLEFAKSAVTAKEIIENSVHEQVRLGITAEATYANIPQLLDVEKQTFHAFTAFQRQDYFLVVDGIHLTALEQVVYLKASSEIKFIRITPLVGG